MESSRCWCGSTNSVIFNNDYMRCCDCQTIFKKEMPDSNTYNTDAYDADYWEKTMAAIYKEQNCQDIDDILLLHFGERATYWVREILPFCKPNGNVLEIGCGMGSFSYLMKMLNFNVIATEVDPHWRDVLTKKLGITVVQNLDDASNHPYDIVAGFDVIEHFLDPLTVMKELSEKTAPSGFFVIQTPLAPANNTYEELLASKDSFLRQLLPEQHMYLFSPQALKKILNICGFVDIVELPNIFPSDSFVIASKTPIHRLEFDALKQIYCSNPNTILPFSLVENSRENSCKRMAGELANELQRIKNRVQQSKWCRIGKYLKLFKY